MRESLSPPQIQESFTQAIETSKRQSPLESTPPLLEGAWIRTPHARPLPGSSLRCDRSE